MRKRHTWKYCGTDVVLDEQPLEPLPALAPPAVTIPSKLSDSIDIVQKKTTPIPKNNNEFFKLWFTLDVRCHIDFSSSSSESPKLLYV
jgi:hypothetical protein